MSWFALRKYYKSPSDIIITGYSPLTSLYASLLQVNGMNVTIIQDPQYKNEINNPYSNHNIHLNRGYLLSSPLMLYPQDCGWGSYYKTISAEIPWYRLTTRRHDGSSYVVASHSHEKTKNLHEGAGFYGVKLRHLTSFSDRILSNYAGQIKVIPNFGKITLMGDSASSSDKIVIQGSTSNQLIEADMVIDCSLNNKRPPIFGREENTKLLPYISSNNDYTPSVESNTEFLKYLNENGSVNIPNNVNNILSTESTASINAIYGQSLIETVSLGHREYYNSGIKLSLYPIVPSVLGKTTLFQWKLLSKIKLGNDNSVSIITDKNQKLKLLQNFKDLIPRELMYVLEQTQTEIITEPVVSSPKSSILKKRVIELDNEFPRYIKVGPDNLGFNQFSDYELTLTLMEMFEIVKSILRRQPLDLIEILPMIRNEIFKIRNIAVSSELPSSTDKLIFNGNLDMAGWLYALKSMKEQSSFTREQKIYNLLKAN